MISVVICTYNRANLLADVLQTLCRQTLDHAEYEVIIVDNNSTDDTATVSQSFATSYPNVRFCCEARQGLSLARNRGWQEAKGDYVGYIDDDCKAPEHWLATAKMIIQTVAPTVFGGPYFAFYATHKPPWFKDSYGSNVPSNKAHVCVDSQLTGGNLFIRRDLLAATGGFNATFGMIGPKSGYGEESELFQRIRHYQADAIFYYDPALYVRHLVRPAKMNLSWQLRNRFVHGRYNYRVYAAASPYLVHRQLRQRFQQELPRSLICHLRSLFGFSPSARARYPYYQQYLCEKVGDDLQRLGWLVEYWQERIIKK